MGFFLRKIRFNTDTVKRTRRYSKDNVSYTFSLIKLGSYCNRAVQRSNRDASAI